MQNWTKQERYFIGMLASAFLLGLVLYSLRINPRHLFFGNHAREIHFSTQHQPRQMMVLVKGAVQNPGVYEVSSGTRFQEAVRLSNPLADADLMSLPLADFVRDGETVVVPVKPVEKKMCVLENGIIAVDPARININQADQNQLETLPGIGPSLAVRIIDYRRKHPFSSVDELMEIPGVGLKKFDEIKDQVYID